MENKSFAKTASLIVVVVAIAIIAYLKLVSSSNGGSVNSEPPANTKPATTQQAKGSNQGLSQRDIQILMQSQQQSEGKGEAQLTEAVKSGKPTMILFHSYG